MAIATAICWFSEAPINTPSRAGAGAGAGATLGVDVTLGADVMEGCVGTPGDGEGDPLLLNVAASVIVTTPSTTSGSPVTLLPALSGNLTSTSAPKSTSTIPMTSRKYIS